MRLTDKALKSKFLSTCAALHEGRLTLRTPEGETYHFGTRGPEVDMRIRDWSAMSALAAHGQVGFGESYVQGLWDTSSVENVMRVALMNRDTLSAFDRGGPLGRWKFRLFDQIVRANSKRGSRRNIRAHYDVGNEFYQLWLDEGMTYSSAIFERGDDDLVRGQDRKNARALSRLAPGERLLEIGCGWGGMAEHAAKSGYDVTGVTISRNQHSYADCRLDGRADIQLRDYRDIGQNGTERYDNIVSIEMIEAVGARYWPSYFGTLKRSLADGGCALIQAITVRDDYFETYRQSSDFIRQYVFPGGMLLSDSVIADQAKSAGLQVKDSHAFGQDYAQTCRIWSQRFNAARPKIAELGYGEAFMRNWHYYLEICAAAFSMGQTNVVQVELAHA